MQHIIPFVIGILIFGLIILVHEWGHFIAARKAGILVEEFAVGMGPRLFATQPGETLYTIRMLPLGGYCKMLGADEANEDKRAFGNKRIWQRICVIVAGSLMNFTLTFIIFILMAIASGFPTTSINALIPEGPAAQAGLAQGDRIVRVNGERINIHEDVVAALTSMPEGQDIAEVEFMRGGATYVAMVNTVIHNGRRIIGTMPEVRLGMFAEAQEGYSRTNFIEATSRGGFETAFLMRHTLSMIGQLVTGNASADMLTGPIGIFGIIDTMFQNTVENAQEQPAIQTLGQLVVSNAMLAAIISASIGIFNLIPFPALDGGRLVFLLLEALRRKPIKPEVEGTVHFVGMIVMMALAIYIAYRDVLGLI